MLTKLSALRTYDLQEAECVKPGRSNLKKNLIAHDLKGDFKGDGANFSLVIMTGSIPFSITNKDQLVKL